MPDGPLTCQKRIGDGHYLVIARVAPVDDGQFIGSEALGIRLGFADRKPQRTVFPEDAGQEFTQEQQDHPSMRQLYARFAPSQAKAKNMGTDQVCKQEAPHRVATGKYRKR